MSVKKVQGHTLNHVFEQKKQLLEILYYTYHLIPS